MLHRHRVSQQDGLQLSKVGVLGRRGEVNEGDGVARGRGIDVVGGVLGPGGLTQNGVCLRQGYFVLAGVLGVGDRFDVRVAHHLDMRDRVVIHVW